MKSLTFPAILVWALIFVGTGNIATAQQPSGGQIRDIELKIRVRAAARAELSGTGNMSWLRLSVSRNALGPQAIIFDSLDKCPVTSAEWGTYEIIADVPQDADTITYGLFLVGDGSAWLDAVSVQIIEK